MKIKLSELKKIIREETLHERTSFGRTRSQVITEDAIAEWLDNALAHLYEQFKKEAVESLGEGYDISPEAFRTYIEMSLEHNWGLD